MSPPLPSQPPSPREAAVLSVFCVTVVTVVGLVLVPLRVHLPAWTRLRRPVRLHYACVPPLSVAVMVAIGALDARGLTAGIVGDAKLRPYGIVVLFMCLAYMSISLDCTGAFGWLALRLTRASGGRGRVLLLLYFFLSSIATVLTSNDIVVMTLTVRFSRQMSRLL